MHRPRHPHHHCPVSSFDLPGRQQEEVVEEEEQEEEEQENVSCYAACLTEDLQLFGQLNDLQQVQAGDDVHLLQLTTETPSPTPPATPEPVELPVRRKRASPSKRQAHNICDICSRCFSDAYTLRIHRMTHTDERPHVCEECGKGFRQLSKLRMHAVIHTKERPHECDICGKGYRFANYLAVHRRLHTGEKPYGCTVTGCSLSFHSIHARRMHVKLQHGKAEKEGEREQEEEEEKQQQQPVAASLSYTCPVCGRILTDQCYLNTHLKRHYNQRDFVCPQPQCGKRFFSSSELNHHQITHIRLRRFRCAHCTSRFLRKSNYQQHLKLHQRPSPTAQA